MKRLLRLLWGTSEPDASAPRIKVGICSMDKKVRRRVHGLGLQYTLRCGWKDAVEAAALSRMAQAQQLTPVQSNATPRCPCAPRGIQAQSLHRAHAQHRCRLLYLSRSLQIHNAVCCQAALCQVGSAAG